MSQSLEGKKILLVDDDPDILAAYKAVLSDTGAEIRTASDGNRASELAASGQPDLIVLDMMLPRRSGFLILEQMQPPKEKGKKPFVIMVTANEGRRHEAFARHLGVDEYLQKPVSLDRLMEVIHQLLGVPYGD